VEALALEKENRLKDKHIKKLIAENQQLFQVAKLPY
jgi:hypothetical protein